MRRRVKLFAAISQFIHRRRPQTSAASAPFDDGRVDIARLIEVDDPPDLAPHPAADTVEPLQQNTPLEKEKKMKIFVAGKSEELIASMQLVCRSAQLQYRRDLIGFTKSNTMAIGLPFSRKASVFAYSRVMVTTGPTDTR